MIDLAHGGGGSRKKTISKAKTPKKKVEYKDFAGPKDLLLGTTKLKRKMAAQRKVSKGLSEDKWEEYMRRQTSKYVNDQPGWKLPTKKTRDKIGIHNPAYEVWKMKGKT